MSCEAQLGSELQTTLLLNASWFINIVITLPGDMLSRAVDVGSSYDSMESEAGSIKQVSAGWCICARPGDV